jgi:hypothetical protein
MQISNIKNKKYISKIKIFAFSIAFFTLYSLIFNLSLVEAYCPLCVVGAGAGLTLTRWVGVDDSITGIWIAALLGAIAFWTDVWISKKVKNLSAKWWRPLLTPLIYIVVFASSIWSFYKFNLVVRYGTLFGLDKLTLGLLIGGIVFYIVNVTDDFVIEKNGKVLFPYQRIVISLGVMLILSLFIYILINYSST